MQHSSSYRLTLAHINDTHSNFDPSMQQFQLQLGGKSLRVRSHSGGYARIAFQINQARDAALARQESFLFLHGGDSFQGTLYFSQFKGKANAHLLNLLAPDAMVLGNHEIDAGNGPVRSFLDRIDFPLLAGNMDLSREVPGKAAALGGHPQLLDYDNASGCAKVLLKPLGDRTLAIFGITLDQMAIIARPDPDTLFVNAIDCCRRTVTALKAKGIDHIIVLSHLGLDQDRELAAAVPGISLIVGGHSHTLQGDFSELGLGDMTYGERINGCPIVHAGKYAETLGLASISFDANGRVEFLEGNNFFMLDEQLIVEAGDSEFDYHDVLAQLKRHPGILWSEEDAGVKRAIEENYHPAIHAMEHQVLAFVPRELVHSRLPSKALPHGSELAPWVSRSMYEESRQLDARVQFALHNAGGVRQSLSQGQVTVADVLGRLLPFELPLVKYAIEGRFLYQALESAINAATNNSVIGTGAGSFPYTYGLKYHYDGRKPLGERILSLHLQHDGHWRPLEAHELVIGVSTAYTASGKEGYQALQSCAWQETVAELTLPGAFMGFIRRHANLDEPLAPQLHYISHR
ncbi:bifunctional metallophosphatase/5'-nucleotidase [Shewanella sedimentimangrovi]|nr:bifunctional metallophosphatase/5'-nucleotidase [Shewanella sedimentimangrovi]